MRARLTRPDGTAVEMDGTPEEIAMALGQSPVVVVVRTPMERREAVAARVIGDVRRGIDKPD